LPWLVGNLNFFNNKKGAVGQRPFLFSENILALLQSDSRAMKILAISIVFSYLSPYHVYPFAAFYNDWLVVLGIVVLFAFQMESECPKLQVPFVALVPIGIASIIFLQVLLGMIPYAEDVILPIACLFIAALAIVLGATAGASTPNASRYLCDMLAYAYMIAGVFSVGIATIQFFGQEDVYGSLVLPVSHEANTTLRPFANMAQPNQLALLFCMAIAVVWWFFQTERLGKGVSFFSVLFLVWGLALTQSRIGWLIMPAFSGLVWHWKRRADFRYISRMVIVWLLLAYGAIVFMLPEISAVFGFHVFSVTGHIGNSANSERLVLAQQALQISRNYPLLGAGWYQFGAQQVNIAADFAPSVFAQHSHNLVLNFAAELGWPVTLIVFGGLAYWFVMVFFAKKISKEVGFALLFFVAVFFHSMVEFPLWYAYVLLPISLLMGMVHQQQLFSRVIIISRRAIAILSIVMLIGLLTVAIDYRQVVVGFRALGWENLGLKADEGTTIKPTFTMFPQFFEYFCFAKRRADKAMHSEEIADMERVMHRFGYAPVLMRMSLIYALNGKPNDAVRMMMTIKQLYPNRYAEAYDAWKTLASTNPESYLAIFDKLPH